MGSTAKIIDNIPELLNQTGYFKELPSDVLNRLGGNAEVRQFGKGVILVHAGCLKDLNIYIVLEGQVHLTLPTLDSVRSLRFIDPGMTFGETTLLMLRSALYQSTATRKSRVLVISGSSWLREIESAPGMCKIVLKQLA
jgi:CRP-like cAMP-binding protein